jgi:hypothetical protein
MCNSVRWSGINALSVNHVSEHAPTVEISGRIFACDRNKRKYELYTYKTPIKIII